MDTEALPDVAILNSGALPDIVVPDIPLLDTVALHIAVLDKGDLPDFAVLDTGAHLMLLCWIQVIAII